MLATAISQLAPEDRHRTLQAGFDHHRVKPVKPDELDRLLTDL